MESGKRKVENLFFEKAIFLLFFFRLNFIIRYPFSVFHSLRLYFFGGKQ